MLFCVVLARKTRNLRQEVNLFPVLVSTKSTSTNTVNPSETKGTFRIKVRKSPKNIAKCDVTRSTIRSSSFCNKPPPP